MTNLTPILIFGAGNVGRGFVGHLAHRAACPFMLVDKDDALITRLRDAGRYTVRVLGSPPWSDVLAPAASHGLQDDDWHEAFDEASLCFTAVFGKNLPELGVVLAKALTRRYEGDRPPRPLNVITCENTVQAAALLQRSVSEALPEDLLLRRRIGQYVGFCEGLVFKTCLGPGAGDEPLTVRAENLFELPCDGEPLCGEPPRLEGLLPIAGFSDQLLRKVFTYNCISAVITYFGARKGFTMLSDAACDTEISRWAAQAGQEASAGLVGEFGFDREEQQEWVERALRKFKNREIPDSLARNGADPRRKLGRNDRLVGPALLAFEHGCEPRAIARGILAGFDYSDAGEESLLDAHDGHVASILTDVCGLEADEPLFDCLLRLARGGGT